jgi:putative sigma-54 modulation protein
MAPPLARDAANMAVPKEGWLALQARRRHTRSKPATPLLLQQFSPTKVFPAAQRCIARVTPFRKENLMNLTISGHHLEVTPALREYVINKLDRVTRHFDQVVDITVLLTVEKQKEKERRQKAEVNLHVKGRDIHVEHANEDLYAAIDQLVDKLDRQVCRHKDRLQDHQHATAKRLEASA